MTETEELKSLPGRGLFSEAVVLALFTGLAYLGAYSFELGRADYFRIPTYLVRVGVETLLGTATALGVFILVVSESVLNLISLGSNTSTPPGRRTSLFLLIFWVGTLIVALVYFAGWRAAELKAGLGLLVAIGGLGVALIGILYLIVKVVERFSSMRKSPATATQSSGERTSPAGWGRIDPRVSALFVLVVVGVVLCRFLGEGSARRETNFLTFRVGSQDFVAVGTLGDYVVAKDFYREYKEFGQLVRVIPLGSVPSGLFQRIGPLNPVGSKMTQPPREGARNLPAKPSASDPAPGTAVPAPPGDLAPAPVLRPPASNTGNS